MTDEKPAQVIHAKFALRQLDPMTDDEAHELGFPYNADLLVEASTQATATVTITDKMIQLAAEAIWNRRGGSTEMWAALAENYRDMARVALEAALAAPPPAPSEDA